MYRKLVLKNVKKSFNDYLIYFITMIICVMLFYAFLSIASQYYKPDLGSEYSISLLSDGLKLAICMVTLLLIFLIQYVNKYMFCRRQKEFAVLSTLGMEKRKISWLFFAETSIMGVIAIFVGILLGVIGSQMITGMLLSSYGLNYQFVMALFPDTVVLTVVFFSLCFLIIGFVNVRMINKLKIIDMLHAEKNNEPDVRKSRYLYFITVIYAIVIGYVLFAGINRVIFYYDSRYSFPVKFVFGGNIIFPLLTLLWNFYYLLFRKKIPIFQYVAGNTLLSVINVIFEVCIPLIQKKYYVALESDATSSNMLIVVGLLAFFICGLVYLSADIFVRRKERNIERKYNGTNLFFIGQIVSKLNTTSKTVSLISITLVVSILLFVINPILLGWISGYSNVKTLYDIQINSRYNNVYSVSELPKDDYTDISDFLKENNIETAFDCTFNLYLPLNSDFKKRIKSEFPVVAVALSDYNAMRVALGYESVSLGEDEFLTQWQSLSTQEEKEDFINSHKTIQTDEGILNISGNSVFDDSIGETLYNSYTDVIYVFPDDICEGLLPVMRNRFIITKEPISYDDSLELEETFFKSYSSNDEEGENSYYIRTKTQQKNSAKSSSFILQATLTYCAVIIMVICMTILSLQQLFDIPYYRYRFGVLNKLGVDKKEIKRIIIKQIGVWYGLPLVIALGISLLLGGFVFNMISIQIKAYIGTSFLFVQIGEMLTVFFSFLLCYLLCTWKLLNRAVFG